MAYTTGTLTGKYLDGGQIAAGTVEIIPNSRQVLDATGKVILAGRTRVTLDNTGAFSIVLPATDDAGLQPAGRQYAVSVKLHNTRLPVVTGITLPAGSSRDMAGLSSSPETVAAMSLWLTQDEYEDAIAGLEAAVGGALPAAQREVAGGVAGLTMAGKIYEARVPDRLSDASLTAAFAPGGTAGNLGATQGDARYSPLGVPAWSASQAVVAGAQRLNPSGNLVVRLSAGTTRSTYDTPEAALWKIVGGGYPTIAGLPSTGIIFAHRGAELIFPEETNLAFDGAIASGAHGIEFDCQLLADGALAVIHDDTVDRTTTSSGAVSSFSSMAWKLLTCDPASFDLGPGWPNQIGLPLVRETLAKYGRQTVLMLEPKSGASVAAAIANVTALGLQDSVIMESSAIAGLTTMKAAGLKVYHYWSATVGTPDSLASVVAAGADFLGGPYNLSNADIALLVATGKPVILYGVNRQYDKARLDALGVAGYMAGDPAYLLNTTTPVTTDHFSELIRQHGENTTTGVGTLTPVSPNKRTLSAASVQGVAFGHMSPIANRAGTYSLSADVCYETLPGVTRTLELCVAGDDINYPVANFDGYSATIYSDGTLRLFKHVKGGNTTLISSSITTPALTAGGWVNLKIDVTPTTVKVTRDNNVSYATTAVADTTYRGGFIHFSKAAPDASASIRNIVVA